LFDVRVMIRQGLQYAVARGMLVSAVPALAAIFLLDLLLHGDQPAVAILRARGWIYAGLGALALVAQVRQKQWLAALDRRFFRERYDAQRLLREVVEEVRQPGGFERVAPRVVARIEAALHPEFVALLVRDPREANYRSLAAARAVAGQAEKAYDTFERIMRHGYARNRLWGCCVKWDTGELFSEPLTEALLILWGFLRGCFGVWPTLGKLNVVGSPSHRMEGAEHTFCHLAKDVTVKVVNGQTRVETSSPLTRN
jgi:hypothetical protein